MRSTTKIIPIRPLIIFQAFIFLNFIVFLSVASRDAEAGGAVVKRRQAASQQRNIQMQRQIQMQAQLRIHQQQMQQVALQRKMMLNPENVQANMQGKEITQDITLKEEIDESQVKDVVAIEDIWEEFKTSSRAWALIMETKAKMLTISKFIDQYHQQGITIGKSPLYYARVIDTMASENPTMLDQPFEKLLQAVAIIDYDFDNGIDKDTLAMKLLGEKAFLANKQRLGMEAQAQDARVIK